MSREMGRGRGEADPHGARSPTQGIDPRTPDHDPRGRQALH